MLVYLFKIGCKITNNFASDQIFLHIFAVKLLIHVKSNTNAVVLLADFTDGLQILVSA